jgi:hypothetical protein
MGSIERLLRRRRGWRLAALAQGLVHDDRAGDRDVERGDAAGHGDAQQVVAGLLDQVVQAGALAAEDQDAVGAEVEVGVVGGAALVEAETQTLAFFICSSASG